MHENEKPDSATAENLDWLKMSQRMEKRYEHELFTEKLIRKTMENPFVPIGTAATVVALVFGLRSLVKGDRKTSQLMMRARVGAQGFTIVAMVVGFILSVNRKNAADK